MQAHWCAHWQPHWQRPLTAAAGVAAAGAACPKRTVQSLGLTISCFAAEASLACTMARLSSCIEFCASCQASFSAVVAFICWASRVPAPRFGPACTGRPCSILCRPRPWAVLLHTHNTANSRGWASGILHAIAAIATAQQPGHEYRFDSPLASCTGKLQVMPGGWRVRVSCSNREQSLIVAKGCRP